MLDSLASIFLQTAAGPVGSCEYELEPIVEASKLCPDYCPEGQLNQLPYGPGFYGGITTKDQFQFSRQEMDV
jgi:hypothetical protein